MTGKLEIFSGPTGQLVYDSVHGTEVDGYDELVDNGYGDGILLYYNAKKGVVHAYFNATRNAPEQFIGKYQADNPSDNILTEFKSQLQTELDHVGWPLLPDAGGKQEFFNNMGTVSPVEPSPSINEIIDAVTNHDSADDLKFGVPDRTTAAGLVEHIQSFDSGVEVVVTEAYVPDGYEDAQVKIFIGESESGVVPINNTKDALRQDSLRKSVGTVKSSVTDFISTATSDKVNATRQEIVWALKDAQIESLGLTPKSPVVNDSDKPMQTWGIITTVIGVTLGLLTIGYLSHQMLLEKLEADYPLQIFNYYEIGTYESWLIVAVPAVAALGIGIPGFLRWVDLRLGSDQNHVLHNDLTNKAGDVISDLQSLRQESLIDSDQEFQKKAGEAFEPLEFVSLELADSERRETRIQTALGVAMGLMITTIGSYLLWETRSRIFEHWQTVIDIIVVSSQTVLLLGGLYGIFWIGRKLLHSRISRSNRGNQNQSNESITSQAKQESSSSTQKGGIGNGNNQSSNGQSDGTPMSQSKTNKNETKNMSGFQGGKSGNQSTSLAAIQNERQAQAIRARSSGSRKTILILLILLALLLVLAGVLLTHGPSL